MKLLNCTLCGDIISPNRKDMTPRKCHCERFAVWWRDGNKGLLSVFDRRGCNTDAWILGITNAFLQHSSIPPMMKAETIQAIIDGHPDSYLFKSLRSCIIRIRPGDSNDTQWEDKLPETTA